MRLGAVYILSILALIFTVLSMMGHPTWPLLPVAVLLISIAVLLTADRRT